VSDILVYALTASIDYRYDSEDEYKAKDIFDLIRHYKTQFISLYEKHKKILPTLTDNEEQYDDYYDVLLEFRYTINIIGCMHADDADKIETIITSCFYKAHSCPFLSEHLNDDIIKKIFDLM